jgi:hypothetical protein
MRRAMEKIRRWLTAEPPMASRPIPPSLKSILPSLSKNEKSASIRLAELKWHLPSVQLTINGEAVADGEIRISLDDLRKLLRVALSGVSVDEQWYTAQDPAVGRAVQNGKFRSATEHYILHGYLEGRLPSKPFLDERAYLQNNPDVAQAVKTGKIKSALDHYIRSGYIEGRSST